MTRRLLCAVATLAALITLTGCETARTVTMSLPGHAEHRITHCPNATGRARIFVEGASRATFKVSVYELTPSGRYRWGRLDGRRDSVYIGEIRDGECVGFILSNDGARGLRRLTVTLTGGET